MTSMSRSQTESKARFPALIGTLNDHLGDVVTKSWSLSLTVSDDNSIKQTTLGILIMVYSAVK